VYAIADAICDKQELSWVDRSANGCGAKAAEVGAEATKNMGGMPKLTFGDKHVITMTTEMTEADFRGKLDKSHGAQIVAAFLPKCT
jgi:hypothetical protein